jgi:UDP-N-acetylmuramyl pentapeptide phosphotransferase/UDP-N-acetylglucosamine-1-phosphate transferase
MLTVFISFLTSFAITLFAIPMVLRVTRIRKLFDEPDARKIHQNFIPSLGGVAIFSGIFFSIVFWSEPIFFAHLRWIILSLVIIFLLGLKDDIVSIDPYKKLIGQIFAASLIVIWGNMQIDNLHGLFGIYHLPYMAGVVLTIFAIIVIINSYNLIDGIDGLAGGIGVITSTTFGLLFLLRGDHPLAVVSFSLTGSLLAFLKYNFSPATIFMGDSGSLVIGFVLSILCIELINTEQVSEDMLIYFTPSVVLAILIIPLADTLRVFIIRILQKKSPFHADRNHIHHLLLNIGLNHKKASLVLYAVNALFISISLITAHIGLNFLFFLIVVSAFVMSQLPSLILSSKKRLKEKENTILDTV